MQRICLLVLAFVCLNIIHTTHANVLKGHLDMHKQQIANKRELYDDEILTFTEKCIIGCGECFGTELDDSNIHKVKISVHSTISQAWSI
jgi:hypothetical protein